jgi:diguanylate cyclase (GGDEF)-like protein
MSAPEQFSILLVDDDPTVIRILSRILNGFAPLRFATSGHAALKLAHESVPDLVLLDIEMPDLSGFDVCKTFKSDPALAQVPIVFITSHESPQLEALGLQLGAVDFIGKPPHAPLVLARVRTYQRLKILSDTVRGTVKIDFLTGALSRRELERTLAQEWLRSDRSGAPIALLVAGIDAFASYNAEFGEERGDACLRAIANALRSVAQRPTDVIGRHGGGKFALLLPETDLQGASRVAQRAVDAVDTLQILHARAVGKDRITLSVGVGFRDSSRVSAADAAGGGSDHALRVGMVPHDLVAAADHALQNVRAAGGHGAKIVNVREFWTSRSGSSKT